MLKGPNIIRLKTFVYLPATTSDIFYSYAFAMPGIVSVIVSTRLTRWSRSLTKLLYAGPG